MRKTLIIFFLLSTFFWVTAISPVNAQNDRWEEWPKVQGATAESGPDEFGVFYDPQNQEQILIYPACWMADRRVKKIFALNCGSPYKYVNGRLLFDTTWRNEHGLIEGVEWGDAKMDVSTFSYIFRRPKFKTNTSIWTGKNWLHINNLPIHRDKTK